MSNMEDIKKDLALFRVPMDKLNSLTVDEVKNAYRRIETHPDKADPADQQSEDEMFARDNFGRFHFRSENQGSFTVNVEDSLAEIWQECFQKTFGSPRKINNPTFTESD